MRWHDLLFAHWPVPADALRPLLPAALPLDTRDGQAWIAIVAFWMSGIRHCRLPPLPRLSSFPELNVRTYVRVDDKPGVYFITLDAHSTVAAAVARLTYRLNYLRAHLHVQADNGEIRYRSERTHRGAPPADFRARYRPIGPVFHPQRGTLEHWLIERYCLYAADRRGRLYRAEIHHAPWPLQPAAAEIEQNMMTAALGIALPDAPPLLHYTRRIDALVWPLERITSLANPGARE